MKYMIKFIEETCHTYEVEAVNEDVARGLAENEYYGSDYEALGTGKVKFVGKEPEANELISCTEVKDE